MVYVVAAVYIDVMALVPKHVQVIATKAAKVAAKDVQADAVVIVIQYAGTVVVMDVHQPVVQAVALLVVALVIMTAV